MGEREKEKDDEGAWCAGGTRNDKVDAGVDFGGKTAMRGTVQRVRRTVAWLLLALWLPATLHCGLEAAEVFHPEDNGPEQGCCQGANAEHRDECATVEGGSYRSEQNLAEVPTPIWLAFVSWDDLCWEAGAAERTPEICPPEGERDCAWVPAWHFARRAAASPRAPDSNLG